MQVSIRHPVRFKLKLSMCRRDSNSVVRSTGAIPWDPCLVLYSLVFVAVVVVGAACGSQVVMAQGAKSNFKLAYIPCGRINDQSWSQAGYEGVLAAQKELGIDRSPIRKAFRRLMSKQQRATTPQRGTIW